MCGIAGTFGSAFPLPETWLPLLRHRGPDGEGTWISPSGQASLAHTRLAIIDPLPEAAQPMASDCGRWHLAFNGEIYNFRELREKMQEEGVVFRTTSDTEVLLLGLAKYGCDFLPRLAGMFAFGFWDEQNGQGLLGRDPFGIKPLYLREQEDTLSFASEVRVLQTVFGRSSTDSTALSEYLRWGSLPEPLTLDGSIRELRSGHWLTWGPEGVMEERSFSQVGFRGAGGGRRVTKEEGQSTSDKGPLTKHTAATETRAALLESMERHLVSDVPVGIFLSGGIDSSVVLALAREVLGSRAEIRTFSIGFDDPAYDESDVARRTASRFGSIHTEWILSKEEGLAEIPGYLAAMDQPTIDGFNTWCVSKLVRRHGIKVALSGLGGDELFGGYASFRQVPQIHRMHSLLGPAREIASTVLKAIRSARWQRLAAYLESNGGWWDAFHAQRGIFLGSEADRIVRSRLGEKGALPNSTSFGASRERELERAAASDVDRVSFMELTGYMKNQLLRDSDVFSMAQGLELRVPLVDARLFVRLSRIPAGIRFRRGKRLLLEAVPEVPEWVWKRKKSGFRFPFQEWMEEGFGNLLSSEKAESDIDLKAWYRRWTLGALRYKMETPLVAEGAEMAPVA